MARLLGLSAHSAVADYESGKRLPAGDIITGYERVFAIPDGRLQKLRAQALAEAANAEYRAAAAAAHFRDFGRWQATVEPDDDVAL